MLAVVIFTLWTENRQQLELLKGAVQRATGTLGVNADLRPEITVPAFAIAAFFIIWLLAGKTTRRAASMIAGLNAFAVSFVGLVVLGQ